MENLRDKVKQVVANQFDLDYATIDASTGPTSVDGWDSAAHIALIMNLEDEFDIEVSDDEIATLISIESISSAVERYRAGDAS